MRRRQPPLSRLRSSHPQFLAARARSHVVHSSAGSCVNYTLFTMKTLALLAALALTIVTTTANAGTRCRTSKSGSVTYTTCKSSSGKSECRSSQEWQRGLYDMPVISRVEFSILWLVGLVYYFVTAPRGMSPFPVAAGWVIIGTTIFSLVVLGRRFPLFGYFFVALVAGLISGSRRRRW